MAHHQGMSLLALTSRLLDQPMQRRFEADPALQSALLLLQERVPKSAAPYLQAAQSPVHGDVGQSQEPGLRVFADPGSKRPAVQLLSNGRYHVMLTSGGGGYSRRHDMAVTRWQEDISQDNWGMFCYLRDVQSNTVWSAAHQPTLQKPESHEAILVTPVRNSAHAIWISTRTWRLSSHPKTTSNCGVCMSPIALHRPRHWRSPPTLKWC
jgi:hypothetical protein